MFVPRKHSQNITYPITKFITKNGNSCADVNRAKFKLGQNMHFVIALISVLCLSYGLEQHHGHDGCGCHDEYNYNPNWCDKENAAKKVVELTQQYQAKLLAGDNAGILAMSLQTAESKEIAGYCGDGNCCVLEQSLSDFLSSYSTYTSTVANQQPICEVTHLHDGRIVTAFAEWSINQEDTNEWYVYRTEITWKRVWGCVYKIEKVTLLDHNCQGVSESLLQDCNNCY